MKNEATANSFKAKMLFKGRKILISLKRNYYIIPLIFTLICAAYFLCTLYILSPVFFRIQSATSYSKFNSLFIFLVSLAVILYSIAYLNYAIKKYGKNRPLYMLIIFYVLMVGSIALLILLYYSNYYNYLDDLNIFNTQPDKQVAYREFLQKDIQAHNAIIVTLVLAFVDLLIVSTAPLVQSKLKKLKFKQIDENTQYEGKKEDK